uniref:Reticulocalbin-3 n=1 Tax=Liphistius thaleban TaxID=1905330 RepID=A0A4Q8K3B0_9ARAC
MFNGMNNILFLIFVFCLWNVLCSPHSHNKVDRTKEVEDGVYNSRDHIHYQNGEHHSEFDHEAILGSHNTAEEFDHLSPEEAKRRLKLLAHKMDKNHDTYIDRKELIEWVLMSFKTLTEEEALEQLEDEDGDEDGKISWQEHVAETYGIYKDDDLLFDSTESSSEYKMLKNDQELFKVADLNNDGILDKSEFPAFSHPEEFEHMHQIVYEQAMEKRDKDKDGYLSFDEFIADSYGAPPIPTSEHYIVEKDRFVNDFDQDKDGKLNREEVLLWLIPNNIEMAENEADHLIESSDGDNDGKLSIQEITDHHDIFVGSEATDFGEHLHNSHKFSDEL